MKEGDRLSVGKSDRTMRSRWCCDASRQHGRHYCRTTAVEQRHCHFSSAPGPCSSSNLVGARDLNPGPHGPEIWAVSSTERRFEGFELISVADETISILFQPSISPGLLHE